LPPFVPESTIACGRSNEQACRAVSDKRQAVVRLARRRIEQKPRSARAPRRATASVPGQPFCYARRYGRDGPRSTQNCPTPAKERKKSPSANQRFTEGPVRAGRIRSPMLYPATGASGSYDTPPVRHATSPPVVLIAFGALTRLPGIRMIPHCLQLVKTNTRRDGDSPDRRGERSDRDGDLHHADQAH